jgi:hypothetical protein
MRSVVMWKTRILAPEQARPRARRPGLSFTPRRPGDRSGRRRRDGARRQPDRVAPARPGSGLRRPQPPRRGPSSRRSRRALTVKPSTVRSGQVLQGSAPGVVCRFISVAMALPLAARLVEAPAEVGERRIWVGGCPVPAARAGRAASGLARAAAVMMNVRRDGVGCTVAMSLLRRRTVWSEPGGVLRAPARLAIASARK